MEEINKSQKYSTEVIQMLISLGLMDKDSLVLIMSVLATEMDCLKMKQWLLTLKTKPTLEAIVDKAEEISNFQDPGM